MEQKGKLNICSNLVNFDCEHIVNIVWFVQNSWKISKKKKSCLSLKATLELFLFHIMKFDENH